MPDFTGFLKTIIKDEDGGATGWNLAWFAIVAAGAGLAIDVSNARQAKEHLNVAAEAAAHRGLLTLAAGGDETQVRSAVMSSLSDNVAPTVYGRVVASELEDIELAEWDPKTSKFVTGGTPNAVKVLLRRDESTDSALQTYLLNWIGLDQWSIRSSSATAFVESQRCSNNEGIFAHGEIQLRSSNTFGPGVCLHSMDLISLSNHNEFKPGAFMSMPDLDDCPNCEDDLANPGISAASYESNYQLDPVGPAIQAAYDSFMGNTSGGMKTNFFAKRSLAVDLTPLSNLGFDTTTMAKGDVVNINAEQFVTMTKIPGGLTYNVYCSFTNGGQNGQGNSSKITTLRFDNAPVRNAAIITNCSVNFGSYSDMMGAVILSTRGNGFYESAGARVGSQDGSCDPLDRVWIMVTGDSHVAAKFVSNNITIMVDGDMHLSSGSETGISNHKGVAMHVSGDVDLTTTHTYNSCGASTDQNTPSVMAIRNIASN